MTPELATLIDAGRELTPEDRFELAHQMLVSVETTGAQMTQLNESQTNVDVAWTDEISSRVDDILNGKVATVPFSQSYAKLRAELDARRR